MATESVSTSTSVGFDSDSDDKGVIKITNDWGFRLGAEVRFRVWPSVGASVVTNYGVIYPISSGHEESGSEYVTFSNSDTASTEYPIVSGSAVQAGPGMDSNGNLIGVSFTIENGQVKASQPFYGGAIVTYTSSYSVWGWISGGGGSSWWNYQPNRFNYAITILAFYRGATATYTVEYGSVEVEDSQELYRVTSSYIVDPEGSWEKPPDFPEKNVYPNSLTGPNQSNFQENERIHETAYLRQDGYVTKDKQWIHWLQPYTGSPGGYSDVVYKLTKGSSQDETWAVAFQDVDWNSIEDDLRNRYKDIEIT